jgi:hypothetical protein
VFVTGSSRGATSDLDYAAVAYNAATGARRWVSRYNGPENKEDFAVSVAAGPGGRSVFVTGRSPATSGLDYATVAYNAANGASRWASRYNGPASGADCASSLSVSPGGSAVFVTGTSSARTLGRLPPSDYATVATVPPPAPPPATPTLLVVRLRRLHSVTAGIQSPTGSWKHSWKHPSHPPGHPGHPDASQHDSQAATRAATAPVSSHPGSREILAGILR